jgi:hypothetical protein
MASGTQQMRRARRQDFGGQKAVIVNAGRQAGP